MGEKLAWKFFCSNRVGLAQNFYNPERDRHDPHIKSVIHIQSLLDPLQRRPHIFLCSVPAGRPGREGE